MTTKLEGIIVPVLTPFTPETDEVDIPALKRLVDWIVGTGASALIANAGTGEFYHLSDAERYKVAEVVVEQVSGRVPVLVGAGAIATKDSIKWAKHAESIGACGVLVSAPYYEPPSKTAILRHFVAISEATSIPIMLYNTVFATQVLLTPDDIALFTSKANIPWVKLTTAVVEHIPMILDRVGDRVSLFEGMDTLAFPSLAMGVAGCVLGAANAIPEQLIELWHLLSIENNLIAARELYRRIAPLLDFLSNGGVYCSAIKEICRLRGYPMGTVRLPWEELNEEQRARVLKYAINLKLVAEPQI